MAPKKDYTSQQMSLAIEAVRKGNNVASSAKQFGVPRITLRNKVTGKSPACCSMGPPTVLSLDEEKILVEWLLAMANKHCPIGKELLLDSVQHIVKTGKRKTPFTDDRPGRKWFDSFLKRHPILAERIPQNLTTSREAVKEEQIRRWFSEVQTYLAESGFLEIMEEPSRIFNTDESAFFFNPKPGHVLTRRGDKNVYSTSGNEKENLTVLVTANAAGQLAPPMVVFAYERIPKNIADSVPDSWGIGRSESGWMCGSTFYEYVTNIFYPWLVEQNIKLPVILFLDGHASHLTKHLSDFCCEKQIHVIALYPNSTHILQPLDIAVFRPLKMFWRKHTRNWKAKNLGQQIKKEHFCQILQLSLEDLTPDCIMNGFRAGGLYPFGPDFIDFTKLNIHNRKLLAVDPDDTAKNHTFLTNLESEVRKIFGESKLEIFNKCFFLNRTQLNEQLPNEDLTLFTIWAKYRHMCKTKDNSKVTHAENDNLDITLPIDKTNPDKKSAKGATEKETNQNSTNICIYKTPIKDTPSTSAEISNTHIGLEIPVTSSLSEHMKIKINVEVPSPFKKVLLWPEDEPQKKRRMSKEKTPAAITSKAWKDFHLKKEIEKKNKEDEKEKKKRERLEKKARLLKEKEIKKTMKLNEKRTRKRRRTSITSSDESDNVIYNESGESEEELLYSDEDFSLIMNKSTTDRFAKNEQNEGSKDNLIEAFKSPDLSRSVEQVSPKVIVEELPRIDYPVEPKLKHLKSTGYSLDVGQVLSEAIVEVEELLQNDCLVKPKLKDILSIDDYVLVQWGDCYYPGQIVSISEEGVLVNCLKRGKSCWRWPTLKDMQLYDWEKVICKIEVPKFIKKGCFVIPEMDTFEKI